MTITTSDKESDIQIVQIALLKLIPLVIILVWIALMYDKLLTNPILALLLVLGVLVMLFGGTIRFGPIRIQKWWSQITHDSLTLSLKSSKWPLSKPFRSSSAIFSYLFA